MEICPDCGMYINQIATHFCNNSLIQTNPLSAGMGNLENVMFNFDTKTDQIQKQNEKLKNEQVESGYKDKYIIKLKKRNKKLLKKIQELYHKYLKKAAANPEFADEELVKIIDDLLNEIILDINDLLKEDE